MLRTTGVLHSLCNYYLFGGKRVILAENLQPANIEQIIDFPLKDDELEELEAQFEPECNEKTLNQSDEGKRKVRLTRLLTRFRDLFKFAIFKHDENAGYLFLGLEEQTEQCLFMPVRVMLYDAMAYTAQTEGNLKRNYHELSQMISSKRIIPVITLVVYFGKTNWTSPRSLYDMMPELPEELKNVIPNFWINLLEPLKMDESDYKRMESNWGTIFEAFKQYVDNGSESYYNYLRHHPKMADVSIEDVRLLETMTECEIPIEKDKGGQNMNVNKAMDEYFKKHDKEVIEKAKLKIIEDARSQIIEDAKSQIIEDAKPLIVEDAIEEMAKRMVKCGMSTDDIQKVTFWSVERIEDLKKKMDAN